MKSNGTVFIIRQDNCTVVDVGVIDIGKFGEEKVQGQVLVEKRYDDLMECAACQYKAKQCLVISSGVSCKPRQYMLNDLGGKLLDEPSELIRRIP